MGEGGGKAGSVKSLRAGRRGEGLGAEGRGWGGGGV